MFEAKAFRPVHTIRIRRAEQRRFRAKRQARRWNLFFPMAFTPSLKKLEGFSSKKSRVGACDKTNSQRRSQKLQEVPSPCAGIRPAKGGKTAVSEAGISKKASCHPFLQTSLSPMQWTVQNANHRNGNTVVTGTGIDPTANFDNRSSLPYSWQVRFWIVAVKTITLIVELAPFRPGSSQRPFRTVMRRCRSSH